MAKLLKQSSISALKNTRGQRWTTKAQRMVNDIQTKYQAWPNERQYLSGNWKMTERAASGVDDR